ncbi:MAG TPA: nucleotide exchange factor GrpE [Phycisphaerales bacterium]|nr:nucleotide exchange factor GrpE [Phycisphaerales bacterium]
MPEHDQMNDDPRPEDISAAADADMAALMDKMGAMEAELEAAKGRAVRVMADFQNFQRRAAQNEQTARQSGVSAVATSVVGVIDHFDMALTQDPAKASAQQIIDGVKVIREELLRSLTRHGVTLIQPQANDEFHPGQHEAIMQQPADGVEPGRIVACFQTGYALQEGDTQRILRPAKVSVAPS